ncbi:hypothetical protein DWV63_11250 [Enterococcus durans]|nr:hypothetical protein CJZ72_00400 [Enterococcus durans]RGW62891.1 hypothetical protein DWV63_11250 [Enterococcus durans]
MSDCQGAKNLLKCFTEKKLARNSLFFVCGFNSSTATDKTISPSFENTTSLLPCSTLAKKGVEKSHLFFFSQQTGEDFSTAN